MNAVATQIIGRLGGTAEVSRMFGLSMPSVSDWKKTGIPKARLMFLEVAHAKALRGLRVADASSAADFIAVRAELTAPTKAEAAHG